MQKSLPIMLLLLFGAMVCLPAMNAAAKKTEEELAKESVEYSRSTIGNKPTPQLIMEKVDKACALLEKEGTAAFPKFKGEGSEFLFGGTYVWIHNTQAVIVMHPIETKMVGKQMLGLKDVNGKRYFAEMIKVAQEKGAGWVDYLWHKPGEKDPSQKVSYVKLCKTPAGEELIAGCGVYDMDPEQIKQLVK